MWIEGFIYSINVVMGGEIDIVGTDDETMKEDLEHVL